MGKKILVIDDDKTQLVWIKHQLTKSGYDVLDVQDSRLAIEKISSFKPLVVIVDILMPNIDGFTLIKQIREVNEFRDIKIIVVTAKSFDFDQNRAFELGANAYMVKPIKREKLKESIEKVIQEKMKITFWGTRGTLPKPGKDSLKFGGNTSCVSVELSKDRLFIFDAGTGLVEHGKYIISQKRRFKINLFVSHPHWDHIHGFPFFAPLYQRGNEMAVYGSPHANLSLREVMSSQMESIYFPITIREFASRVYFREISEGDHDIEGLSVSTILLNHPGNTLGYKLKDSNGKSVAYITDNELVPNGNKEQNPHFKKKLIKFLNKVDVLIHDSSYFDSEYKNKIGWGHPPITEVLNLAVKAKVKKLYLSHHDPAHDDDKIAKKEAFAKLYAKKHKVDLQCLSAAEGHSIVL